MFLFLKVVDELARVALMLEQRAPARVGRGWCAVASAFVEVHTAGGAESLAVFAALDVCRSGEEPGFSHRRTEVQIPFVRIVHKHIRVIRLIRASLREKEVYLFVDIYVDLLETKTARQR